MIFRRGGVEVKLAEPDYAALADMAVANLEKAVLSVAEEVQTHAKDQWYQRAGITYRTGRSARAISVELRFKGDLVRAVVFGAAVPLRRGHATHPSYYVKPAGALRIKKTYVRDIDEYWRLVSLWRKGVLPPEYVAWGVSTKDNRPRGLTKVERNPGPGGSENWQVFVNQDGKHIAIASMEKFETALQASADQFIRSVKR